MGNLHRSTNELQSSELCNVSVKVQRRADIASKLHVLYAYVRLVVCLALILQRLWPLPSFCCICSTCLLAVPCSSTSGLVLLAAFGSAYSFTFFVARCVCFPRKCHLQQASCCMTWTCRHINPKSNSKFDPAPVFCIELSLGSHAGIVRTQVCCKCAKHPPAQSTRHQTM
jgi:hypothetical protein